MKNLPILGLAFALSACATVALDGRPPLDQLARDYLALQLAIGEKDPGYVDAYYGPQDLADAAKANDAGMTLPMLQARVLALDTALAGYPVDTTSLESERVRYLRAMLSSAKMRLRVLSGEKIGFQDEAEALFGVRPQLVDLRSMEPVIAQIEALVPGDESDAPLGVRANAFLDRFAVPQDRLRPVIDAAMAECKRRTLEHVTMPASESFDLFLVNDKPWGGFNYYQGNYNSRIEINTDRTFRIDRAVDIGCHEGYPGHHVFSTLVERDLTRGRGWIENSLLPLYSPRAIITEGSAKFAAKMAFPGDTQIAFEREVIAPLAGIETEGLEEYYRLAGLMSELRGAYYTIADGYLSGTMSREDAVEASMRYRLLSRKDAEQSLRFVDAYRTYIINYDLGEEMIEAYVERAGDDEAARWARFVETLNTPLLPEDLD